MARLNPSISLPPSPSPSRRVPFSDLSSIGPGASLDGMPFPSFIFSFLISNNNNNFYILCWLGKTKPFLTFGNMRCWICPAVLFKLDSKSRRFQRTRKCWTESILRTPSRSPSPRTTVHTRPNGQSDGEGDGDGGGEREGEWEGDGEGWGLFQHLRCGGRSYQRVKRE